MKRSCCLQFRALSEMFNSKCHILLKKQNVPVIMIILADDNGFWSSGAVYLKSISSVSNGSFKSLFLKNYVHLFILSCQVQSNCISSICFTINLINTVFQYKSEERPIRSYGAIVSVFTSSTDNRGFDPWSNKTRDWKLILLLQI